MARNNSDDYQESPSGGRREFSAGNSIKDRTKDANSGLSQGGFMRFTHTFNKNALCDSPTTSAGNYRPQAQEVKINRGIAGKIKP